LEFKDGVYRCDPCDGFAVVADGVDHAESSSPSFDTAWAQLASDNSLRVVRKKAGTVRRQITITPSPDGEMLDFEYVNYPNQGGEPTRVITHAQRRGKAEPGQHPINGEWFEGTWEAGSENVKTSTIDATAERVRIQSPTGEGYEAKFDGRAYPVIGDDTGGTVRVKMLGPTAMEETYSRAGKVENVARYDLSADRRTLTITSTEAKGRTDIIVFEKQR
jgi:hypothetical protein